MGAGGGLGTTIIKVQVATKAKWRELSLSDWRGKKKSREQGDSRWQE